MLILLFILQKLNDAFNVILIVVFIALANLPLLFLLQSGYMLHDRILRPAEVGVTVASDKNQNSED